MCGIVGYTGTADATSILVDGLERLEYRGYDSAGIAVCDGSSHVLRRALGKLCSLKSLLEAEPVHGTTGIGHTRWATHGRPCVENAHPHRSGGVYVTHNGIIENHVELRAELEAEGRKFASQTDSEVIAHLIDRALEHHPTSPDRAGDAPALLRCVRSAVSQLAGAYAIAVVCDQHPGEIIVAKHGGSPLILAHTDTGTHLASDIPAVLPYAREIVALEDGEFARLTPAGFELYDLAGNRLERSPRHIEWDAVAAEKGGYPHFMLKEIHEQPGAIARTLAGRIGASSGVELDEVPLATQEVAAIRRIYLVGCGTAFYACLLGKAWIERLAGIPAEAVRASEFRYSHPVLDSGCWIVPVSQSGETADTLAALRLAREAGGKVFSICNVRDASIPRESHHVLYTSAGPEIGVASTKAFTTQLIALFLAAVRLAQARNRLDAATLEQLACDLSRLPGHVETALGRSEQVEAIAKRYFSARDFLFIGRDLLYPIALEGALKLKEISYIHAEGYAGGELKHGPIALVDAQMPSVVLALRTSLYDKICSNLEQIRSRDGKIIAIGTEGDGELLSRTDDVLFVPEVGELLSPIIATIPLQLLAYHVARLKGTDVDQPRNLAKSVTVE